jgi:transposase
MKTLHKRCAGLDVHKAEVVACLRVANRGKASYELRRFPTTTRGLIELGDWLEQAGCTHVAMEATGVYWKPVWYILEGRFQQILANAAHINLAHCGLPNGAFKRSGYEIGSLRERQMYSDNFMSISVA